MTRELLVATPLLVGIAQPAVASSDSCNCVKGAMGNGAFGTGNEIVALAWTDEGPNWVRIDATSGRAIDETPIPVRECGPLGCLEGQTNDLGWLEGDVVLRPPKLWLDGNHLVLISNLGCGSELWVRDVAPNAWHSQGLDLDVDCTKPDVAFGPDGAAYLLGLFTTSSTEPSPDMLALFHKAGGLSALWEPAGLIEDPVCDSTLAVTVDADGVVFGYCDGHVVDFDDPMLTPLPVGPAEVVHADGAMSDAGAAIFVVGTNDPAAIVWLRLDEAGHWSEETVPLGVAGEVVQVKAGSAVSAAVEIRVDDDAPADHYWDDPVYSVVLVGGSWRIEEVGEVRMLPPNEPEVSVNAEADGILISDGETLDLFRRDADGWKSWRIAEVGFEGECPPCSGCGCNPGESTSSLPGLLVLVGVAWRRMRGFARDA